MSREQLLKVIRFAPGGPLCSNGQFRSGGSFCPAQLYRTRNVFIDAENSIQAVTHLRLGWATGSGVTWVVESDEDEGLSVVEETWAPTVFSERFRRSSPAL